MSKRKTVHTTHTGVTTDRIAHVTGGDTVQGMGKSYSTRSFNELVSEQRNKKL